MRGRELYFSVLLSFILVAGVSCAGNQHVNRHGTARAPGAEGVVEVEDQPSGNYLVIVSASNLLPPARVRDGLTTYVVWFQSENQPPHRVGVLTYNERHRTGEMAATTSDTDFQVVISGESSVNVAAPSNNIVFRASVDTSL